MECRERAKKKFPYNAFNLFIISFNICACNRSWKGSGQQGVMSMGLIRSLGQAILFKFKTDQFAKSFT